MDENSINLSGLRQAQHIGERLLFSTHKNDTSMVNS